MRTVRQYSCPTDETCERWQCVESRCVQCFFRALLLKKLKNSEEISNIWNCYIKDPPIFSKMPHRIKLSKRNIGSLVHAVITWNDILLCWLLIVSYSSVTRENDLQRWKRIPIPSTQQQYDLRHVGLSTTVRTLVNFYSILFCGNMFRIQLKHETMRNCYCLQQII